MQFWFTTSQQGVAFVKPVRNRQGSITDFRFRVVNPAFAYLLGQTPEALTRQLVRAVFSPVAENDFFLPMVRVIQTGETHQLLRHYQREQVVVWLAVTLTRMDDHLMVNVEDVSEQKKSAYERQRRLALESIVSTVSGRLITLDVKEMDTYMIEALAQISRHLGVQRACVFVYSDDLQRGTCVHEWCAAGIDSRKDQLQHIPVCLFAWTYHRLADGQVIRLETNELPPAAAQERAIFEATAVHSMIAVPLVQARKTLGFIGFYTINQAQPEDQNDVSLLETFSTIIVTARQRQQQEAALRRANQRLLGLHAIDQALISRQSADQPPLLMALRHINALVPCERLTIFTINETTGLAMAEYRLAEGVLEVNPGLVFPIHPITDQFRPTSPLHYMAELQPDTGGLPLALNLFERGFRSLVIVPLYSSQVCIGVFKLVSRVPNFFTQEHLQIIQDVASQLAIVLQQQLLDKALHQHTYYLEQRVEKRTREIGRLSTLHQAILNHAGQAIISTDIDGVIQTANQACEKLLGYRADELIGRATQIDNELAENLVPFISYQPHRSLPSPTAQSFLAELTTHGYINQECILIGNQGQQVPVLLVTSMLQDEDGTVIGYVGIATDISTLKAAEEKLQQKNRELTTFFDGALDMHCISDRSGNLLATNQAFQTVLDYSETELEAIPFLQLVHPDEQSFVYHHLLVDILIRPVRNQINQLRKKDGTYRIIEWNAIGIDQRVYGSARDITERQEAEVQLRHLNQRLQLATEAAGQGIWENDYERDILFWDNRLWELHGLEPGRTDWSFEEYTKMIHPDDLPAFLERKQADEHRDNFSNVTRIIRPDGSIRYTETSGMVIRDQRGKTVRTIGVIWDVTERKLAEAALRESEQRFRQIADNVDEVFWIHSVEPFELLYINSAYERVFGIASTPDPDTRGLYAFLDTILDEDRALVLVEFEKYRQGQEVTVQFRVQGTHRFIRWLQIRTFIINDQRGDPFRYIGLVTDITSQKEKELVLQVSLQREQELNQLKTQFVSTASHEFRTPLTTIQTSVDLIELYLDQPPTRARPSIQQHLKVIHGQIQKIDALLTDLLSIGRIEAGKIDFKPEWGDMLGLCQQVIATHFSHQSDQRTVHLSVQGQPYRTYFDEKLMSHVLVNLLSNAFKFSTRDPRLSIHFQACDLVIQVLDEGIGIPAGDLAALFQTFFRARNTVAIPGTGLGLVIAHQFVELHEGTLTVESTEHQGTTFTLVLPSSQTTLANS